MDTNTEIARRLIDGLSKFDTTVIGEVLADDVVWEIPADLDMLAVAGTMDRDGLLGLIGGLSAVFPSGMTFEIAGITSQGDRVAIEANGHGATGDGYVYRNRYHFLLETQDGQVRSGKEFCDTLSVAALLGHLQPVAESPATG